MADCRLPLTDSPGESFPVDITVHAGELVICHVDDADHEQAVVRAACGLLAPVDGAVAIAGHDWRNLDHDAGNALRGRIGVVPRQEGWIPHLSVLESMVLPQLHHTRRPIDSICAEAAEWTARFGLPGLPCDPPSMLSAQDRRAARLASGFIGSPDVVIVEDQVPALPPGLLASLVNAIAVAREGGGAILWFTRDAKFCLDRTIPAARRQVLDGRSMMPEYQPE